MYWWAQPTRLNKHGLYHRFKAVIVIMKQVSLARPAVSIASGVMLMATVVGYFAIVPESITIHVGDDECRVNEIGRYGYVRCHLSVICGDLGGDWRVPSIFFLPNGRMLSICHGDQIDSISHFRHERPDPNQYGTYHDDVDVDSFTLERPRYPFLSRIAIFGITGYLLKRFPRVFLSLYAILILCLMVWILRLSTVSETVALLPMLVAVGWLTSPIFGHTVTFRRYLDANEISTKTVKQSG